MRKFWGGAGEAACVAGRLWARGRGAEREQKQQKTIWDGVGPAAQRSPLATSICAHRFLGTSGFDDF